MDSVLAENPPRVAWAIPTRELTGGKGPNDDDDDDDDDMENVSEKAAVYHSVERMAQMSVTVSVNMEVGCLGLVFLVYPKQPPPPPVRGCYTYRPDEQPSPC